MPDILHHREQKVKGRTLIYIIPVRLVIVVVFDQIMKVV